MKLSPYKGTIMNKFACGILAIALSVSVYSVSAATTTSNTDDASALGTSETPQLKQQVRTMDNVPAKKSMSKKNRMHKKMSSETQDRTNTNSMNDKPIGTTNGVSNNGSTDDTKVGKPINGTTTGTNNDDTSSTPKGY
jgi:hypothetical protein